MEKPLAHIVKQREVRFMKHREFVYTGEPMPRLDEPEYAAFLTEIQKRSSGLWKEKTADPHAAGALS